MLALLISLSVLILSVTLLLRKQRAQDRIEGREPLDWRDENYAIVDETKVGRIYTQRIHEEMKCFCPYKPSLPGPNTEIGYSR